MMIRALGKKAAAEAHAKTHPFADVPEWADGYVSYAYENGLTNGVSDTLFNAQGAASAEMYLTFMLRALGYSDGDGKDFRWDSPWALAAWCGILPPQVGRADFRRADMVAVTGAALFANSKATRTPLHERLASEGVFTAEQFEAVFADNPFSAYRTIDMSHVAETLEAEACTILLGGRSGPHGDSACIYLIYKPGSSVGVGEVISLPMPLDSIWGNSSPPDDILLSEDGLTLRYTYHFDERLAYTVIQGEPEWVGHEAGTYIYTVDLATGETALEIAR
jgi:hypothetical protein